MMDDLHVALFSGGKDSAVATHAAMRFGPAELVMYLDTTTGLERNRRYVRRFTDRYNWHLIEWRTPYNYDELVRKYGCPGPSKHEWFYRYLKERQISKLSTIAGGDVHFYTGVWKGESEKRMQRVVERDDGGRWIWHAPLANWTADEFRTYMDRFQLPRNPLWSTLGRSGDCYCGAYGNRMELIDLDVVQPDRSEQIRKLEEDLEGDYPESVGFDDKKRCQWAWHDDRKHVAEAMEDDEQFTLCSACGVQ